MQQRMPRKCNQYIEIKLKYNNGEGVSAMQALLIFVNFQKIRKKLLTKDKT
jgi:hypothetical protein